MKPELDPKRIHGTKTWAERKYAPPSGESYMVPPLVNAAGKRDNDLWTRPALTAADFKDPYRRTI